jgi:hypothetical protein
MQPPKSSHDHMQGRAGLINAPRQDDEALKRGSDSLLESKIRDIARKQTAGGRAHSLDLSLVLARIVEGSPEQNIPPEHEETSDPENESPSSVAGGSSYSYRRENGNGPPIGSPIGHGMAGSRMSAPAIPFIGSARPHAMRMNSGIAEDVIRGMRVSKG